ncbi:hypothetical protein, variant 18 [Aphanomyces invadans]|uniref:Uncharacterized protein n=1 Tax=Aphanomyces invadans TaxID=157072 RepID=A0A024TY06_9STRA|nr:hypothetical protein, variant 18 [Aphanomyces invadans]ETV99045.1 hypothetical protein, variant 18 [Aphanomyces invadans]|eukprot:XP_008872473.1 hypothetical protein, variant 18 [Aphanomyces invadans]
MQLCLRALASLWLALVTVITALYSISWGWPPELPSGTFLAADSLAWGMSTALIWMEHRRSLRTSPYLRAFWILRWSLLTKYLWGVLTNDDPAAVGWTSPMVLLYACLFVTHSILASAGVWPTRQLTTSSPEVLAMARARIKSFNGKSFMNRPLHPSSWVAHRGQGPVPGSYGSFGQSSTAPHDGTPSPLPGLAHTPVVVRVPKVKICIPSWTLSRRSEISFSSCPRAKRGASGGGTATLRIYEARYVAAGAVLARGVHADAVCKRWRVECTCSCHTGSGRARHFLTSRYSNGSTPSGSIPVARNSKRF